MRGSGRGTGNGGYEVMTDLKFTRAELLWGLAAAVIPLLLTQAALAIYVYFR